jgi:hypothetical protein
VWHVSVSVRSGRTGDLQPLPGMAETAAVAALSAVGDPDREWWIWSPNRIGHLRVPVTDDEFARVPPGVAYDDAGETGPLRPRTKP